jgi:hypothetical protein
MNHPTSTAMHSVEQHRSRCPSASRGARESQAHRQCGLGWACDGFGGGPA